MIFKIDFSTDSPLGLSTSQLFRLILACSFNCGSCSLDLITCWRWSRHNSPASLCGVEHSSAPIAQPPSRMLLLAPCYPVSVTLGRASHVSKYKTWAWLESTDSFERRNSPLLDMQAAPLQVPTCNWPLGSWVFVGNFQHLCLQRTVSLRHQVITRRLLHRPHVCFLFLKQGLTK